MQYRTEALEPWQHVAPQRFVGHEAGDEKNGHLIIVAEAFDACMFRAGNIIPTGIIFPAPAQVTFARTLFN
jgi:hypothetical protein